MKNGDKIKVLLDGAVELLHQCKRFDEAFMLKAQKLGLQGEKRRLRYHSVVWHNLINYFRCDAYDLYGLDLNGILLDTPIPTVSSIKDFAQKYLAWCEEAYDNIHTVANNLVVANARNYAEPLYERCDCLAEIIKEYRRIILEGEAMAWKAEYLFLRETTGCNVHDHYEKKEHEVGYNH